MIKGLLIALIRLYQRAISPWLGTHCRFEPSCSRYAVACLEAHGVARGGLLSIVRVCKCQPFHPGGFDPPSLAITGGGASSRRASTTHVISRD